MIFVTYNFELKTYQIIYVIIYKCYKYNTRVIRIKN